MSYILDALRRADAERERGEVPSLRTQQYGALPGDDHAARSPRLLVGAVVILVLALAGALAWNFRGDSAAGHRTATPAAVIEPAPPPTTVAAPPPAIAVVPAPAPAQPALPPRLEATTPAPQASHRLAAAAASSPRTTAAERRRASRAAATSLPASAAENRVGKLPDDLRREVPTLAFGGASYSNDAASRMVIFNGRVFHEGDTIAPQLILQQIKLKSAILVYKGYRYEMDY